MNKVTKISIAMIALVGALGAIFYWYFLDGRMVGTSVYEIDLKQIRSSANEIAGEKPFDVQVEKVAQFDFPRTLSEAGSGFDIVPMGVYAFRIVSRSGNVVIDSGYNSEMAASARADFFQEPYSRTQQALSSASKIVITHEHFDHIGGIVRHPDVNGLKSKLVLTVEQVQSPEAIRPRFKGGIPDWLDPLSYERYFALAPGVVLIKAQGHTPGSQMIFAQLDDGREYLFVGDIAWLQSNIKNQIIRPRFVSGIFLPEESRTAISAQLKFLNGFAVSNPQVIIVAGHDNNQIEQLIKNGALGPKFLNVGN